RLFIEFPRKIDGFEFGPARATTWERGVVASDFFGPTLPKLRIVQPHDCRYLPVKTTQPVHLAISRVAGYDTAVYGLGRDASPLLFETSDGRLIATTKLS